MSIKKIEQKNLDQTIEIIQREKSLLKKQQTDTRKVMKEQSEQTAEQQIHFGSDEAFYESAMDYRQHEQELLLRHHTLASQEKRLSTLAIMEGNPYFARIDFEEDKEAEHLYIGIASLRDHKENPVIIDWRTPVANLFYEGELGRTKYEAVDGIHEVRLDLKRQFKIRDGMIQSMADTSDTLTDDFLLEILDEASSDKMKNIVSTIQKTQNAIIRDKHPILMVQGIAGSGKTSALLQRVAYIIYSNRKWLDPEQVLLFSPNHLFSDYISNVLPSLGESGIPTLTFQQFIQRLLPGYTVVNEMLHEETFLTGKEDKSARLKSGLALPRYMEKYIRMISGIGPIFSDIRTGGKTLIDKGKIRNWYLETNSELPMYQRMQLLQTRLLTKLGGIQKDEAKKKWVKDAVDEIIDDVVASQPNFEDTEQNERRLRRQLAQSFAAKKIKPAKRRVNRFHFISCPMQYQHFLQSVPAELLKKGGVTEAEWKDNLKKVQHRLKQKMLMQEDGVLLFLMMRQLYPVNVRQKARYIFVDETQDFSPSQVWLLKELYPKSGFNFCGDLNQKVFDNETVISLIDELFFDQEVKKYQLTTSYRSTKQITAFASAILGGEDGYKTTARDGALPMILSAKDETQAFDWLRKRCQEIIAEKNYWRTAIIAKSLNSCETFYSRLDEETKGKIQFIQGEDDFLKKKIILIPAYLAKGLEFDQVVLWDVSEENFHTPQDQLILYTMATRGMHELTVLTSGKPSSCLTRIPESLYQKMFPAT